MIVHSAIEKIDGRYRVTFFAPQLTAAETQAIRENGEPIVDIGGAFSGTAIRAGQTDGIPVSFSLPNKLRMLQNDFPLPPQIFDLADNAYADVMSEVWRQAIIARLQAAKATLNVGAATSFEGEFMTTI